MEGERLGPVLRARHAGNVTKQTSPVRTKKSVSVAAVFRQQPQKTTHLMLQPALKSISKVSKKKSDMHPLAVAFKDTSDDYRRHLYQTTTLKISKTLESLLHALCESNLRTISFDGNVENPQHSPIRLTVPAEFEREVAKLYLPISQYQIRLTRTSTNGEREKLQSTLETRMLDYVDHVARKRTEVEKLKKDWETIVGEIWRLGVTVLGEDEMETLLFTNQSALRHSSSPLQGLEASVTALEGSTLFVPEHGTSPLAPRKPRSKKRVTFENLNDLPSNPMVLDFLYQPSVLKPVRVMHGLPEQEIEDLEKSVQDLGTVHISDLRKISKERQDYWRRKTGEMSRMLESDEEETEMG